jgi:Bifunctional DNA primase/polymerase, N-terminal
VTALDSARDYVRRGWNPVPIPHGSKGPRTRDWHLVTITSENVAQYFNGSDQNIGVQLGPTSGGLCDVDLDCAEAMRLALRFLPATVAVFGRRSKPRSHYLYKVQDSKCVTVIKHCDEEGRALVELRIGVKNAAQTMFPPSLHPGGELVGWDQDGDPTTAPYTGLEAAVRHIAVAAMLLRYWPRSAGSRHDLAMRVGGFLARADFSAEDIDRIVDAVATEADDEEVADRRRAAGDSCVAFEKGTRAYGLPALQEALGEGVANAIAKVVDYGEPDRDVPVIKVNAGELTVVATSGEKALLDAGVPMFQRSEWLVRPVIDTVDAAHGRETKVARFIKVEATYLRDLLGRVADFRKKRSNKWVPIDPPPEVAQTILARQGEWKFPGVAGVIATPTMRADGSLLIKPGYDPSTKLLLMEPPSMPPIPDAPTKEDALRALSLLRGLLTEFPLVGDVDRAVALSALITPVVRGAFMTAPMHVARAPVAGSGKSFLFDLVAAISIGQFMPVISAGPHEEELEKRLGTSMMTGQPLISIDNVNGELKGDALCQIIERPVVDIRILGRSERVKIEARGTTIFCTGNNIILVGDLCRRVVTATLDPKLERPDLRVFEGNPFSTILTDRGAYIAAALIVCRAYVVAGQPHRANPIASFEGWSNTVRSALIWLGEADPASSMEAARADDPELGRLRQMLEAWAETLGVGRRYRYTLAEVIKITEESIPQGQGYAPEWPKLNAAVQAVASWRNAPADVNRLAVWMRGNKGRMVGDWRFVNKSDGKGAACWWIEGEEKPGERIGAEAGDRARDEGG